MKNSLEGIVFRLSTCKGLPNIFAFILKNSLFTMLSYLMWSVILAGRLNLLYK